MWVEATKKHKKGQLRGQDIESGSDPGEEDSEDNNNDDDKYDGSNEDLAVLGSLKNLSLKNDKEEAQESEEDDRKPAAKEDHPLALSAKDKKHAKVFEITPKQTAMLIDFIQFGRTVGNKTRYMIAFCLDLPPGVQINTVDAQIKNETSIEWSFDFLPGIFLGKIASNGSLKQDLGFQEVYQHALNAKAEGIKSNNGRVGVTIPHKLDNLPSERLISVAEGFVDPYTFDPPQDDDVCHICRLSFNQLDNTCASTIVFCFVLLEKQKTTSIRQNRYRYVEVTSPHVEAIPHGMAALIAATIDSPSSNLVCPAADATDTSADGVCNVSPRQSGASPRSQINAEVQPARAERQAVRTAAAAAVNVVEDVEDTTVPSIFNLFGSNANNNNRDRGCR